MHSPQQLPYSEIPYIGIAINGDEDQRHVGLLFRQDKTDEPMLLHLAFHNRLKCDTPKDYFPQGYFWLNCSGLNDDEQLQLAVWFDKVWTVNQKRIPYGLAYSSTGYFDPQSGAFIQAGRNLGLTCATFVVALFEDFAFPIVDVDSWQARETDAEWQEKIINWMKYDQKRNSHLYSETHIEEQLQNIGIAVRFRPEEVAGSASVVRDLPIDFQQAVLLGENLLSQMGLFVCRPG